MRRMAIKTDKQKGGQESGTGKYIISFNLVNPGRGD